MCFPHMKFVWKLSNSCGLTLMWRSDVVTCHFITTFSAQTLNYKKTHCICKRTCCFWDARLHDDVIAYISERTHSLLLLNTSFSRSTLFFLCSQDTWMEEEWISCGMTTTRWHPRLGVCDPPSCCFTPSTRKSLHQAFRSADLPLPLHTAHLCQHAPVSVTKKTLQISSASNACEQVRL